MIELYVLAAIVGIIIISREWKRSQERRWDDEADYEFDPYGEKPKRKNAAGFTSRIRSFLEPDPFTQGYYTDNPVLRVFLWIAKIIYIVMIAFALIVMMVPVVRWAYNIPPDYSGPLDEYSKDVDSVLGGMFFLLMIIGIAFFRHWPWRVWHALLVFSFIGFIVFTILYELAM